MRHLAVTALASVDVVLLVGARPDLGRLAGDLAGPHEWIARDGADGATATLAAAGLWFVAVWVALGLLTLAAARLPGAAGGAGAALARLVVPRTVRTLLAGSTGLGLLLAPVAAGATAATAATHEGPAGQRAPIAAGTVAQLPGPVWPLDDPPSTSHRAPDRDRLPAPAWPEHRDTPPASPVPDRTGGGGTNGASGETVTVHRGDSLWLIAARRLTPDADPDRTAASWPRWYAANRAVIGDDPARLLPGQVLHVPAPRRHHTSRPASEHVPSTAATEEAP